MASMISETLSLCPASATWFSIPTPRRPSFTFPCPATAFLEWLTPSSLCFLALYSSILSLHLNERGDNIDDAVIASKQTSSSRSSLTRVATTAISCGSRNSCMSEMQERFLVKSKSKVEHKVLEGWCMRGASPC